MRAILEAVQAEREDLEEGKQAAEEALAAEFGRRFAVLDEIEAKTLELNGNGKVADKSDPPPKPRSKPKVHLRPPKSQASGKFEKLTPDQQADRKRKILAKVESSHPEMLSSKVLREEIGLVSASGIRPLLDSLIEEGKLTKAGERAGTKYGLTGGGAKAPAEERAEVPEAAKADVDVAFSRSADDDETYDYLKAAGEPKPADAISLTTEISVMRVRGAVSRLSRAGKVHLVRGDDGIDRYECSHDGRGRIE